MIRGPWGWDGISIVFVCVELILQGVDSLNGIKVCWVDCGFGLWAFNWVLSEKFKAPFAGFGCGSELLL